jgi:dTDP-4-amino-4,6-dideoxygalactose transaminase
MAAYLGAPFALGVSSGTDALTLSMMALGIGPGDEVITSPFTFFATAGSIARLGARPVFVDILEDTFNLDERLVAKAITKKTKAILPVHLFGQCCAMPSLLALANQHHLQVIEDAAQSLGASQHQVPAGRFGVAACFSFFPSKNLGGAGDGGLIVTRDPHVFEKMKMLREHGSARRYHHSLIGGNFRLDVLQAVILSVKLKYLDRWTEGRRKNAALYDQLLRDAKVRTPIVPPGNAHVYNQYCILSERRDELKKHLGDRGIGSEIYYPLPLHLQECFQSLGYRRGDFPVAESVAERILALPVFPELSEEEIRAVAEAVRGFNP